MSLSDKSSETSSDEKLNGRQNGVSDDVCRDYLRNVCKRGKRCRYSHPPNHSPDAMEPKQEVSFCHDYQNSVCKRPQCRFVHCTREEEEYFRNTGQFPPTLIPTATNPQLAIMSKPLDLGLLKGDVPICKDYLKGECKRGGKCKYKHLSNAEFDFELRRLERSQRLAPPARFESYDYEIVDRFDHEVKRRRLDYDEIDRYPAMPSRPFTADYKLLEEENLMLRRRIEELRKQVTDLAATNEVLLEQNARFRVGKTTMSLPVVTSTTPPSVVTGQVVTPTITPAPIVASSITSPRMPVLHTSLPRQIPSLQAPPIALNAAMTSELAQAASQQVIHQQIELAQEMASQQASLNANAENLTQAPLVAAPVQQVPVAVTMSITNVSGQQSLPNVSMPQRSLAPIRMSGPVSAAMVTYPIISQGVHRPTSRP